MSRSFHQPPKVAFIELCAKGHKLEPISTKETIDSYESKKEYIVYSKMLTLKEISTKKAQEDYYIPRSERCRVQLA